MPSMVKMRRAKWKRGKRALTQKSRHPEHIASELTNAVVVRGCFEREAVWVALPAKVASAFEQLNLGRRVREAVARDVHFVNADANKVRLSPGEAFYLHAILGCLVVYRYDKGEGEDQGRHTEMSREELWSALRESAGAAFGLKCIATCHFRLQGWLPRSGLQYGADFVLYRRHPSLVHSDCCALILPENAGARKSFDIFPSDERNNNRGEATKAFPKWYELQALSRLCVQVNKKLILCSISVPEDCDWNESGVIAEATIKESEISRFNQLRIKNQK